MAEIKQFKESEENHKFYGRCRLASCKFNVYGKCTSENDRKFCVDVARCVLCLEEK